MFTAVSSPVTLKYRIRLDCGLIRPCLDPNNSNLTLTQNFFLNSNPVNTTNNGTPAINQVISYPFLVDETASSFNNNYLQTITVLHKYRNTGLTDAVIQFQFNESAENLCSADSLLGMEYATGDANSPGTLNYSPLNTGWNAVTIKRDSALFIRKHLFIKGCTDAINGCNEIKDTLIWRCQQNAVCDTCQSVLNKSYALNNSGTRIYR